MKTQVVIIHGGRTFKTYQEYIESLKHREVTIETFTYQGEWRNSFQQKIGNRFEVLCPKMPNGNNAVYKEWKIWFERLEKFLRDGVILVGHSLGGIFLAKYLSQNLFGKKIKAVFLVAAPCEEQHLNESLGSFLLPKNLKKFEAQAGEIYLLFSDDDPIVPISHLKKFKKLLPHAKEVIFSGKQHFNQESFPEIIRLIKKIKA